MLNWPRPSLIFEPGFSSSAMDEALTSYCTLDNFDEQDLIGAFTNVSEDVKKTGTKTFEVMGYF